MSDADPTLSTMQRSRHGGLNITDDIPGTRLKLEWIGPRPWGWGRILFPVGVSLIILLLGSGEKGPWMLAWTQLANPGKHDVVEDIILGAILCFGLYFMWSAGSVLGMIGAYWKEITVDSGEMLVIAERRGWLIWGHKSTTVSFPQLQFCSLRTGRESRGPISMNLSFG